MANLEIKKSDFVDGSREIEITGICTTTMNEIKPYNKTFHSYDHFLDFYYRTGKSNIMTFKPV